MQPERMTGRVRRSGFVDSVNSKETDDAGEIEGTAESGGRRARGQAQRAEGQRAERSLQIDARIDDRGTTRGVRLDQAQGQARARAISRGGAADAAAGFGA